MQCNKRKHTKSSGFLSKARYWLHSTNDQFIYLWW